MSRIYHFTDVGNIEGIVTSGRVLAHTGAPCRVDIGDQSIKSRRTTIRVPVGPSGFVGDYVPFYFAARSPMLFSIQCGNVAGVSAEQRRLAYLVSDTEDAYAAGLACVFTDGNASAAISEFRDDRETLAEHIDWPLMKARQWANTNEDPDRRRRRGAEFLIHEAVPLEVVRGIAVYDQSMQAQVAATVGEALPVVVRRDWYFF